RRQLGAVLDADAARGSRAGVDEPSAFGEAPGGGFARGHDIGQGLPYRGHRRKLAFEHRVDSLETRPGVEVLEAGTELFGAHRFHPRNWRAAWPPVGIARRIKPKRRRGDDSRAQNAPNECEAWRAPP